MESASKNSSTTFCPKSCIYLKSCGGNDPKSYCEFDEEIAYNILVILTELAMLHREDNLNGQNNRN